MKNELGIEILDHAEKILINMIQKEINKLYEHIHNEFEDARQKLKVIGTGNNKK